MTSPARGASPRSTISVLRAMLAVILAIGMLGTVLELVLLKHVGDFWQLVPVVLIGLALVQLAWYGVTRSRTALRSIRAMMVLFFLSGGIGVFLHVNVNMEDGRESNPSLTRKELYQEALMGSTPALAPGTMVQLALIGLAFVFRHPGLRAHAHDDALIGEEES